MTTTTDTDTAQRLAGVRADELADLPAIVQAYAQAKGLTVLPATVETDNAVLLHAEKISVHDLVDAADACGARALYLRVHAVQAEAIRAALPAEHAGDQAVQAELARIDGWIVDLEIGFAHGGLPHVWTATSSWSDTLADLTRPPHRAHSTTRDRVNDQDAEPTYLPHEDQQRWAAALAEDTSFRQATGNAEYNAAAQAVPGLIGALHGCEGWQLDTIISSAVQKVRDQAEQRAIALKPRLDEFAAALAADAEYVTITAADARKRRAVEWMRQHTDHLRLPNWWINDLVGRAKQAGKAAAHASAGQLSFG